MTRFTTYQQQTIERIVTPERARFDLPTRQEFSRDAGVQPRLGPLNGRTLADAVVWPADERELVELVEFTSSSGVALVPRGGGTAGYGGGVPVDGGVVLDLTRLCGLVSVDPDEGVATVRAGTRWTTLETELRKHGVAPRLYPSSASSATVGGWLAQGGAGLGSHAFGWIDDNVEAVRVVGGDGQMHELNGYDLDSVAGAEGTTGILTELVLRVRPAAAEASTLLALPDAASLQTALQYLAQWQLPVWSATFVNPSAAARLNAARHPDGLQLPDYKLILSLVYAAGDDRRLADGLRELEALAGGRRLADAFARQEWAERFKPLRSTFPTGSVAPAEIVVPTYALAAVLRDLERRIDTSLAIEGTSVHGSETVLRVYPTSDEPARSGGFGFSLSLDVMALAERHGGRGYSTGRYFAAKAASIMGPDHVDFLRHARTWLDPTELMNPGKVVFGNALIGRAIQVSAGIRRVARRAHLPV
jgi:FAD/FMN-containing dehydrogenase